MSSSQTTAGATIYPFPSRPEAIARLFARRLEIDVQRLAVSPAADGDTWYHDDAVEEDRRRSEPTSH